MEIKSCQELNGMKPIPRAVTVCQELSRTVKNFKSRQCIMSRIVTNRGRQRFRVAVNGERVSDDLKKKQPRVGTQESVKKEQCQPQAKEQCQT